MCELVDAIEPVFWPAFFLSLTFHTNCSISSLLYIPYSCTLTYPELLRRLPHGRVIFYNIISNLHGSFLNVPFQNYFIRKAHTLLSLLAIRPWLLDTPTFLFFRHSLKASIVSVWFSGRRDKEDLRDEIGDRNFFPGIKICDWIKLFSFKKGGVYSAGNICQYFLRNDISPPDVEKLIRISTDNDWNF